MNLLKYIFNFIFPNYKKFPYVLSGFMRYINDYLKLKIQLKQDSIKCHVKFDPFLFDSQVESGQVEKINFCRIYGHLVKYIIQLLISILI